MIVHFINYNHSNNNKFKCVLCCCLFGLSFCFFSIPNTQHDSYWIKLVAFEKWIKNSKKNKLSNKKFSVNQTKKKYHLFVSAGVCVCVTCEIFFFFFVEDSRKQFTAIIIPKTHTGYKQTRWWWFFFSFEIFLNN